MANLNPVMALEEPGGGNKPIHHIIRTENFVHQAHSPNYIFLKSPSRIATGYYRVSR